MKIKKSIIVILVILLIPFILATSFVIVPHYILAFEPQIPEKDNTKFKEVNFQDNLRVYPIMSGYAETTYGQFYLGHDGWVGIQSVYKILTNNGEQAIWIPVYVFLIEHPKEGLILYDAGLDIKQTKIGYYTGLTSFSHETHNIPESKTVADQVEALGFNIDEVKHIVISHLHEDHVGGVESFPNAEIHISEIEWNDKDRIFLGLPGLGLKATYNESFNSINKLNIFKFDSGAFNSFNRSHDLLGDGSIMLLPTPGHTMGHTTLLVNNQSNPVILTGDAVDTIDHLDPVTMAAFQLGNNSFPVYKDSIERILKLQKSLNNSVLLPSHEFSGYEKVMEDVLLDGYLTDSESGTLLEIQRSRYKSGKLENIPSFKDVKAKTFSINNIEKE